MNKLWPKYFDFQISVNAKTFSKALLLSLICVGFTYLIYCPSYMTNDDPGYAMILSGKLVFNQSTPYILFQHIYYTKIIQFLNSRFPKIPWYPLVQVGLLFVCLVINNCIIFKKYKNGYALVMGLLLYISFFSFFFLRIHFTITSFVLGITAFILLLCYKDEHQKWPNTILIAALLILSSMIRWEAWQFIILWMSIFLVIRFVYDLWKRRQVYFYKYCFLLLISVIIFAFALNKLDEQQYKISGNEAYRTFNYYRVHINDYHDLMYLKQSDRLKTLALHGWTKNDYDMTMYWMFMDRKVYATNKLKAIVEGLNQEEVQQLRIKTNILNFRTYLLKEPQLLYLFVVSIFVLLFFARYSKDAYLIFFISQSLLVFTSMIKKYPPESFYNATYLMLPFFMISATITKKKAFFIIMILCIFSFFQLKKIEQQSAKARKDQFLFSEQLERITNDSLNIYLNWAGLNAAFIKPFDDIELRTKNIIFPGTFAAHPLNLAKIEGMGIKDIMLEITTNARIRVIHKEYNKKFKGEVDNAKFAYVTFMKEHYNMDVVAFRVDSSNKMSIWDYSPRDTLHL